MMKKNALIEELNLVALLVAHTFCIMCVPAVILLHGLIATSDFRPSFTRVPAEIQTRSPANLAGQPARHATSQSI